MVAASSRWSIVQEVDATCPRCLAPLPTIPVRTVVSASGRRTLRLELLPILDDEWWQLARRGHPQCVPDGRPTEIDGGWEVLG